MRFASSKTPNQIFDLVEGELVDLDAPTLKRLLDLGYVEKVAEKPAPKETKPAPKAKEKKATAKKKRAVRKKTED